MRGFLPKEEAKAARKRKASTSERIKKKKVKQSVTKVSKDSKVSEKQDSNAHPKTGSIASDKKSAYPLRIPRIPKKQKTSTIQPKLLVPKTKTPPIQPKPLVSTKSTPPKPFTKGSTPNLLYALSAKSRPISNNTLTLLSSRPSLPSAPFQLHPTPYQGGKGLDV